jgi:hypothetical protein
VILVENGHAYHPYRPSNHFQIGSIAVRFAPFEWSTTSWFEYERGQLCVRRLSSGLLAFLGIDGTRHLSPSQVAGYVKEDIEKALTGCDLVIIPAGVPRKPGMTRDDLFAINAGIVYDLITSVAKYCPKVRETSQVTRRITLSTAF